MLLLELIKSPEAIKKIFFDGIIVRKMRAGEEHVEWVM